MKKLTINEDLIDESILTKLKTLNDELQQITKQVGASHLKKKELEASIEELGDYITKLEETYMTTNATLNYTLDELKQKYNTGTIDLLKGTITYTTETND